MSVPSSGPPDAKIMIVGEAPGYDEVRRNEPFVGASGHELNQMLHEAGIARSQCFVTNVCREQPPGNDISAWFSDNKAPPKIGNWAGHPNGWCHPFVLEGVKLLWKEVELVKPSVILALGNTALWALTGNRGITSWRGSTLTIKSSVGSHIVVPSYHPAGVLRNYAWRQISVHDFKRAREALEQPPVSPDYRFILRPSFPTAQDIITSLLAQAESGPLKLAVDIETRAGHIACLGFAWSRTEALCIPFMCLERREGYWPEHEEAAIIVLLSRLLRHRNVEVVGQNWAYDTQYIQRHFGFTPAFSRDTMLGHHACWPGTPKGLDFLSSVYCDYHVYWKDEGKEWHRKLGEDQLWAYNCKDCVVTYEADDKIQAQVDTLGLREQHDFQQSMFWPANRAMTRGLARDSVLTGEFAMMLSDEMAAREAWFKKVLGHGLNPRSPKQMKDLFYHDFAQKPIINRKTGTPTLDDEALETLGKREPLLRPLLRRIAEHRSLGVFLSTFVGAKTDVDGRLRCSFNVAGTETFRLSSSKNAFNSGLNLQNIPPGGETEKGNPDALVLPNVRELFIPDPGYTFFDVDLDRADLQVVVWEADDGELKQMLREGVDIHTENAKLLGCSRQLAKVWVHGTDYGGGPRTMAINCGITVHTAEVYQKRWFQAHPGIPSWHRRVENSLRTKRAVSNAFGYRRFYFDRIDGILPEALAWIPQSTVAIVINRIWWWLYAQAPGVEVLLQVHDSLGGQFRTSDTVAALGAIAGAAGRVVVPYPEPLIIPTKVKTSTVSWGACE